MKRAIALLDELIGDLEGSDAIAGFCSSIDVPTTLLTAAHENEPVRFIYANEAFCDLCGYECRDIIGETPKFLQGDDTDQVAAMNFRRDIERDGKGFTTLINYHRNGSPYEFFLLGAQIKGDVGHDQAQLYAAFSFRIGDAQYSLPKAS
ncbi:MAG: PAS domain-containing protein [Pseudomonadota bacterium]